MKKLTRVILSIAFCFSCASVRWPTVNKAQASENKHPLELCSISYVCNGGFIEMTCRTWNPFAKPKLGPPRTHREPWGGCHERKRIA